ncbi:MAG TPA: DUF177 domain-containing protein [Vicinamibacteria bacterium]|jgi:uncharacterized protein
MLLFHVSQIPIDGREFDEPLDPSDLHVEGEESFALAEGGRVRGRIEKTADDSVHVRGHVSARLRLQCGRCLEGFLMPVEQDLELFLLPEHAEPEEDEDEVELSDRDMVVGYYRGDRLDLGELLREQLLLELPMKRVCREDCAGLCPTCGTNRNAAACACRAEDEVDPRLAALKTLLDEGSS